MYCKKCGEQVPTGISYCPFCGISGDFTTEQMPRETVKKVIKKADKFEVEEPKIEKEQVTESKHRKRSRLLMGITLVAILGITIFLVVLNLAPKNRNTPIGLYNEELGVFFMESGSGRIYDGITNLTSDQLEVRDKYYLLNRDLYHVNYYSRDTLVAREITMFFEPENYSGFESAVYKKEGDYFLFDGNKSHKLDFDDHIVNEIHYFYNTDEIGVVTVEGSNDYHLYIYDDGQLEYVDRSYSHIQYVNFYNGKYYYVVDNEGKNYKCYDGSDSYLLTEAGEFGLVYAIPGFGVSMIGSSTSETWQIFKDDELIFTIYNTKSAHMNHFNGQILYVYGTDNEGTKMYQLVDDEFIQVDFQDQFLTSQTLLEDGNNSDSQDYIYAEGSELSYKFLNDNGEEEVIVHDISGFSNIQYDELYEHLYCIDQHRNLISLDLETGMVELIQENIQTYNKVKYGVLFVSNEDGSLYFKEPEKEMVLVVENTDAARLQPTTITYDGVHLYIKVVDALMANAAFEPGDVYYFNTKNYRLKFIGSDTEIYYMLDEETFDGAFEYVVSSY